MINKIKILQINYSDGLSCPFCNTRILPGDIDEYPEDQEWVENYTVPNYCKHVSYCVVDETMIEYLSEELTKQLEGKDYNESDFLNVAELNEVIEYQITPLTPGDAASVIGFKYLK